VEFWNPIVLFAGRYIENWVALTCTSAFTSNQ
jgi:hypothetical protein